MRREFETLGIGLFTRRFRLDSAQCGFRGALVGYALRSEAGTLSGESATQLVPPLPGRDFLSLFDLSYLGASFGFRLVLRGALLGGIEAQLERAHCRSGEHSSHSMISSCDIRRYPVQRPTPQPATLSSVDTDNNVSGSGTSCSMRHNGAIPVSFQPSVRILMSPLNECGGVSRMLSPKRLKGI